MTIGVSVQMDKKGSGLWMLRFNEEWEKMTRDSGAMKTDGARGEEGEEEED